MDLSDSDPRASVIAVMDILMVEKETPRVLVFDVFRGERSA